MEGTSSAKQKLYPWLIVAGCCFMQVGGIGTFLDSCGVFYIAAADGLGISVGEYSSYMTFIFVGTAVAAVVMSLLIDKVDIRAIISVNCVVCAVALAFMGYYPAMWCRKVAGFIFGFSGGFFFMTMTPILINNWFVKKKGLAMGIAMSSSGVGAAILSPLITFLIQNIGWQMSYVVVAIIVLILILPFSIFIFRRTPEEIGLKPYGWSQEGEEHARNNAEELKAGVPYKVAVVSVSFICICCAIGCIAIFSPFNSHLSAFGQSLGYTAMVSSTFLTAVSLGSICEKLVMGWLCDHISVYKTIAIDFCLLAIGLALLSTQTSLSLLYLGAFLFGVQNSLVAVQIPLLVRAIFGDRAYEKLIPITRAGVGVFGLFGPMLIGNLLDATGGYSAVWGSGVLIVIAAALFVVVARASSKKPRSAWCERGVSQSEQLSGTPLEFSDRLTTNASIK